jgi:hypothetical protein
METTILKIELSKEQYKTLLQLVFMGDWLANSIRTNEDGNKEFEDLEQYLYSFAGEQGMENLIMYDEKFKKYFSTREFEESFETIIDEYDDFTFWQELPGRLAKRDLFREIGPVSHLTDNHRSRMYEIEEKYEIEFEKSGLKNLILQDQKKQDPKKKR